MLIFVDAERSGSKAAWVLGELAVGKRVIMRVED